MKLAASVHVVRQSALPLLVSLAVAAVSCAKGVDGAGPWEREVQDPSPARILTDAGALPARSVGAVEEGFEDAGSLTDASDESLDGSTEGSHRAGDDGAAPLPSVRDSGTKEDSGASSGCVMTSGEVCGLAPQCGCGDHETCVLSSSWGGGVSCVTAGTARRGHACDRAGDCAPGLDCVWGACRPYCSDVGAPCAGPGLGICQRASRGFFAVRDRSVCAVDCDLANPTACGGGGAGCLLLGGKTRDCRQVGAGSQGADCSEDEECAAGYRCDPDSSQCEKWCRVPDEKYPDDCAEIHGHCSSLGLVIGGVSYGHCL